MTSLYHSNEQQILTILLLTIKSILLRKFQQKYLTSFFSETIWIKILIYEVFMSTTALLAFSDPCNMSFRVFSTSFNVTLLISGPFTYNLQVECLLNRKLSTAHLLPEYDAYEMDLLIQYKSLV